MQNAVKIIINPVLLTHPTAMVNVQDLEETKESKRSGIDGHTLSE
jgi:hypothetical protein